MNRAAPNCVVLAALVALSTSCATSPNPEFYALYPQSAARVVEEAGTDLRVEIRRPSLPGYLDRPHIVRRVEAGRLELAGNDRWGSSLQDMVATTLAANLSERVPGSEFFTEGGPISIRPDVILGIEMQRFEQTGDGNVQLIVQVALQFPEQPEGTILHRYELHESLDEGDTRALVGKMSALLAQLSDSIASALRREAPSPVESPRGS